MKNISFLVVFLLLVSCSNNKAIYWCGDHPCINKKERKAYFRETMIVEMKQIDKKKYSYSEIQKITEQAQINEKKRIKEEKIESKLTKLEQKRLIKEKKELEKKLKRPKN